MMFGAIDIGTNAARLLIGEVIKQGEHSIVKKCFYMRLPLRLGDEVFENGRISNKKSSEFVKIIQVFKLISEIHEVISLRAVATSAMREAQNSDEIIEMIKQECGVSIEIISGIQEAKLIFDTFLLSDNDTSHPFIIIDAGGGSTEISIFENGDCIASKSFEIGTIRILKNNIIEGVWTEMKNWIEFQVSHILEYRIYGIGGNINKIHKMLNRSKLEAITLKELERMRIDLKDLSISERIEKFHLKPDRADVIVPAIEIYSFIMHTLNSTEMYVPKIGLSDGMIHQMNLTALS